MLSGLSLQLLDKSSCAAIYVAFSERNIGRSAAPAPAGFWGEDEKFGELVSATLFAGIFAMTYSDLRWGEKARGAMARHYRGEGHVTDLATVAARQVNRHDHSLPPGLVAA